MVFDGGGLKASPDTADGARYKITSRNFKSSLIRRNWSKILKSWQLKSDFALNQLSTVTVGNGVC